MKKLIATAVVAAAAFGAFAIETGVRFENLERGTTTVAALNTAANEVHNTDNYIYWLGDVANTYTVYDWTAAEEKKASYAHPAPWASEGVVSSTNALSVKTTFGKPLSFAVNGDGSAGNMGIYFDSLIKFTVCEEAPEANLYEDAKIAMWLQEEYDEEDNIIGTNLMVKAGFLSIGENGVEVSNAVYTVGNQLIDGAFADKWHRVTIKTIADITDGSGVPGFAIYIDGNNTGADAMSSDAAKWDDTFTYALSEAAAHLNETGCLFPSMVQGATNTDKSILNAVQFDGTGSINELLFTATAPAFAKDYVAPKATILVGENDVGSGYNLGTFTGIVEAVNAEAAKGTDGAEVAIKVILSAGLELNTPVEFADAHATVELDFNGMIITNKLVDCIITNNVKLTVKDSIGTGGIYATQQDGGAICQGNTGELKIISGNFWSNIELLDMGEIQIFGGSFQQDDANILEDWLAEGKILKVVEGALNPVVDAFNVTIKYNDEKTADVVMTVATGTLASEILPENLTWEGYNFTGWDPEVTEETTITEDTTFTAQWTAKTYTVSVAPAGANMTVVVTKNGEDVEYAQSYTVNYGDDVSVVYVAVDGYELTGQATFTFEDIASDVEITAPTATAISYTISYDVDGIAATTYTVADLNTTIDLPTASREGYTFDGWTNETYTAAIKSFTITVLGNVELYAKWTENPPATPVIPEGETSVEVEVNIPENANDEEIAGILSEAVNSVKVAEPSVLETADQKAEYQNLFTKKAEIVDGKVVVTAEIKETVKEAVAQSAVDVLNGVQSATVEVPQGLFYKVTTMTSLDGTGADETKGISNGAGISITKPGDKSGFIKIQIGTQAY